MAKESWKTREATAKSQKNASTKSTSQSSQKSVSSRADYNRNFFNSEMEKYQTYDRDTFRAASLYEFQQKQAGRRGQDLYDDFNRQASAFDRAVARDLSDGKGFNAAQYFEERQKQADALKQRADTLKLFMEDHMDLYTPEFYDPLMENLSGFNTQVDDVLAQYKPSFDSKAGMRAYEDELRAAMEKNEQMRALDKMSGYDADPMSPAGIFMNMLKGYQHDEEYRNVNDSWTAEERYNLGMLQREDPAKAVEYAVQVNNQHNAQLTEPQRQQIRDQAPGNIWKNSGKALLAGIAGSGEVFDRIAETAARGRTTEKGYITPSDYTQETTGAISEYLNQKYGTVDVQNFQNLRDIGQQGLRDANVDPTYVSGAGNAILDLARDVVENKGVGDLYNLGYSLAQNMVSRYTLGAVGGQPLVLANYFANSATSAVDDARRRGATGSQAMGIGLIKGALEVGTEFIPTSELFKMGPAVTVKDFLKSVGIEALEEFVGEGANALGGYIADKAIMGDLSEFETAKRTYMEEHGMTEEQAHAQAIKDAVTNIVSEGISGALSGAVSGGVESGLRTGLANQYYRNVDPRSLIDEGMNAEQDSDAYRMAQQMQERIDNDKRVSNNQKRVLSDELRKLAAAKVAAEAAAEEPASQEQETKKPAEKPAVSKEGRSIQISTESPIDTMDFAEIKNGNATIQLKDGGTVDYSDVSFATEAEANQYYAVSTLPGIETEAANDLLHTIQEAGAGQDDQSIIAVREAYRLGYAVAQASELASSDASALTPELQQKIFEIGQSQRRADAMAKPTVREAATKPTEGYKKVVIEGKISKPNKKTQKKWDAEIAFMDYIADNFSGNAVHVYESYKGMDGKYYYRDSNGKVNRAPNGMYVNGEIWVDLRSGDNQEGLVLNTFAHEMYHHIERFDKAKAQELAEFVVKELGMESVDKAVEAQIQKARKAGLSEAYFMNVKGMTAEQARNEVYMRAMSDYVADSLETMFTRGDPAKAIADLKKENRTLFDQIKAFIDKWVSKLKDFYKDKTVSEEGAVVAQLKNFEQLQKLFMEGVQSAGANYRAAEVSEEQADQDSEATRFSMREIVGPSGINYGIGVYLDSTLLDNLSEDERVAMVKEYIKEIGGSTFTAYDNNHKAVDILLVEPTRKFKNKSGKKVPVLKDMTNYLKDDVKQEAITLVDELILTSTYRGKEPATHPHDWVDNNGANDWDMWTTYIQDKKNTVWEAKLRIANSANGEKILYDIFPINKVEEAQTMGTTTTNRILSQPASAVNVEMNSLRNEKLATDRDILMNLDANAQKVSVKGHLQRYQDRVSQLFDLESKRELVNAQIKELSSDSQKNRKELAKLRSEARNLTTQIKGLNEKLMFTERSDMMRSLVAKKRLNDQRIVNSYKEEQKDLIRSMREEHRAIRKEITGTDSVMFVMEDTFLKLAKDYEAKKIDMKTMENEFMRIMKEYENVKSEYDSLMWEYQNSGWKVQKLEAKLERQKEAAKSRVNKAMYAKIQRKADELNRLLLHGSKHRNIPEYLQPIVAQILDSINMETKDAIQRANTYDATLERYNKRIAAASDPLTKEALIEQKKRYMAKGDQFANKMAELKEAYKRIQDDSIPGLEIDEGLAGHLQTLFEEIGNTPLREMTRKQLNAVNDVLNITKKTIVEANKLHQEGQRQGVEETSKNAMREIRTVGGGAKKTIEIAEAVKKFGWDNLKPVYVFEAIGSKVMTGLFNNLRKGEDTLARDLQEGRIFFQNQWQKHKGENWDKEKKWAFTSTSGKRFELDLMQIMSLYALSKRDQARDHLRVGGFSFDSQYKVKDEVKIGPIKFKADVKTTDASAYNLSDETLGEIIGKLTAEQRAFVDEMQAYLSDTMAAKGNEISMQKYGIRLFKEKNYFPLRVSDQFMAKVREQQTGDRKLKNSGFTKETTPNAKNPVVLSSFLEVWAEHVDEMSLYHSFVLPLDDMSRVLNYHDAFVEENAAASVVEAIRTAYGEGATKYIDQLIRDINGGARADGMASTINKLMSTARKAQTMGSLSVAIQQPSSILRACAEIDGKYFLGRRVTEKMHDSTWEEIKAHAPIAIIKEKGGFDTNVGKSTVEYLTDTDGDVGFWKKAASLVTKGKIADAKTRDDVLGRLPALMDEMAWGVIWNAVKREQADKHPNMDVKSDAFMKLVADRFTDVIVKTQVYDSVFSRSGMMRSKDSGVKMATAFMAEPTTTANMLAAAIFKAKRGEISKADAAKTVGAIVASLAANAALVSLVYAMRDDDEDKRYDEKWIQNFWDNLFGSLNPIGYIPILRDIQSMARGFDVERADMALFGDLMNAIQGLSDEKRTAWEKTEAVIGSVGNLFGVPLKNIIRDGKGFYKTLAIRMDKEGKDPRTKTGIYMARRGLDLSNGEELLLAIQRGDVEHIQRVAGRYENQQKAESALQSAIRQKYLDGDLTAEEAEELLTNNFDRDDDNEVYWLIDEWDYAKENGSTDGYAKYGKFQEGVESGDFQTEMERLMEHGAEASDIRSSITRKYRKQYLAEEDAREDIRNKLRPVFEATGMYDDEIDEKFNDWDFEAEYGMTYSAFKDEYKAGNVTEAEMRDAMDFYGLLNYEIAEAIRSLNEDIAFEKKYGMSLSEMEDAYDHGDVAQNQMKNALVFTGMTQNEAKNWIKQRNISNQMGINYAEQDDAYKHGDISRQTLYNSMIQNGATKQEADEAIIGYDWLKKHVKKYPELTINDAKKFTIRISDKQKEYTLTDYGVSIDTYIEYTKRRAECTGVDEDGDGQIDSGTLRDEIFRMIDSLPISSEAKDGLAQIGYSIKSIKKNAPWH